jgi:hypothetical protein
MPDSRDADTTRTSVKTYVPAYQKERWERHAERLGMSQSEFVRAMVQAGRRDFEIPGEGDDQGADGDAPRESAEESPLDERVIHILDGADYLSWDELVGELTDDIEDRLEATLQDLQADNRVQYSGRRGGYTVVEGEDAR